MEEYGYDMKPLSRVKLELKECAGMAGMCWRLKKPIQMWSGIAIIYAKEGCLRRSS